MYKDCKTREKRSTNINFIDRNLQKKNKEVQAKNSIENF